MGFAALGSAEPSAAKPIQPAKKTASAMRLDLDIICNLSGVNF
jgi:hypothetical protein